MRPGGSRAKTDAGEGARGTQSNAGEGARATFRAVQKGDSPVLTCECHLQPGWRNWQTQRTQNPPVLSTLGVRLPLPAPAPSPQSLSVELRRQGVNRVD